MFQHYCLYRHKSETPVEPVKSQDQQLSENAATNAV